MSRSRSSLLALSFAFATPIAVVLAPAALGTAVSGCSSDDPPSATPAPSATTTTQPPAATCPSPTNQVKHTGKVEAGQTETWKAADGIHVVEAQSYDVAGKLVIEPCAKVLLGPGVTIFLTETGALEAGTAAGADVTVDALDAAKPWGALRSNYATSTIALHHTRLLHGGVPDANWDAVISLPGEAIDAKEPTKQLLVDDVTITGSGSSGIELESNAGFDPASKGLVISGAAKNPVVLTAVAAATLPEGTYTGNARDFIALDPNRNFVDRDTVWRDRGVPYGNTFGDIVVRSRTGSPAVLTIEAGVTLQMFDVGNGKGSRLIVGDSSTDKTPTGGLVALGTAAKPITFRGSGKARDWAGIHFVGSVDARSQLGYVVIEDTGAFDATTGGECVEGLDAGPDGDAGSGALRFVLLGNDKIALREDFLRNATIRRAAANGVLPDFHPTNGLDFCATNTFEDVALCNQTPFRDGAYMCPAKPVPCRCE
jgi:hypothetical protein